MSLEEYRRFIASRAVDMQPQGFTPGAVNDAAKEHQKRCVEFAIERGKSAAFLDCVAGDTLIETSDGPQRIDALARAGKPIVVKSWSPEGVRWSLATAPFAKGRGEVYQVTLSDGRTIRATAGHRFLSDGEWVAVSSLACGQPLQVAHDPHHSTEEPSPQAWRQGARHYSGTRAGSTDGCSSYPRRYGQRLLQAAGIAQAFAPSLAYALALDGCYLPADDRAHRSACSPSHLPFARLSTRGSDGRGSSAADARGCPPRSFGSAASDASNRILRRFLSGARRAPSWRERLQDQFQSSLGVPSQKSLPCKLSVVSIHKLGAEVYYDLHVPGDESYLANGVWSHNTGLGKSFIELEFARQCAEKTGKPSLILTPLAVAGQMVREGEKFGVEARQIREQAEVGDGVMVANYERLQKLDPGSFGAVILDESSILKSFAGRTRNTLMDAFRDTPYKLAATATPSPNDHTELGNHAEFLGVMRQQEMLSKWFINDTSTASQDWRLKGHAAADFWRWVASWARCATLPSDLGGDDAGYVLPEIDRHVHMVEADRSEDTQGMLFRVPEMSATSFHAEKRLTLKQRCERAAELADHDRPVTVWCETNDESAMLAKIIPGAMEVHGSQTAEEKERLLLGFIDGDFRALVTKPKLAGFGVNWQHCAHAVFASISFSYEQHYQAVRRSHRFGQTERVRNDIVISDTEASIWDAVNTKAEKHDEMKRRMAAAMREEQCGSRTRIKYERPLDLAFPEWLKGEVA